MAPKPPHLHFPHRHSHAPTPPNPNSRPGTPSPTHSQHPASNTTGFRAQLAHLLPRHAIFHARIQIHQLSSVPLVRGEFAARWKVGNVYVPGKFHRHWKKDHEDGNSSSTPANGSVTARSHGKNNHQGATTDSEGSGETEEFGGVPSVVVSDSMSSSVTSSDFPSSSSAASTSASLNTSASSAPSLLSATWVSPSNGTHTPRPSTPGVSPPSPPFGLENPSPSRGMTEFRPLQEHNITWEQSLDLLLRLPVDRSTSVLPSSPLKITIMQLSLPGDPDAPPNPRIGTVYIDLAQYVSASASASASASTTMMTAGHPHPPITRRHLLRDSKTNATLKVSISMEHVGGITNYIAPELPPAEILGGIEGLRKGVDGLTRPRPTHLITALHNQGNGTQKSGGSGYFGSHRAGNGEPGQAHFGGGSGKSGRGFDISKLPLVHGPRTTESLIDALFNPVPTTSTTPSPFTYYVPPGRVLAPSRTSPSSLSAKGGGSVAKTPSTFDTRVKAKSDGGHDNVSMYSDSSEAPSSASTSWSVPREFVVGVNGAHTPGGRRKGWWRKLGGKSAEAV